MRRAGPSVAVSPLVRHGRGCDSGGQGPAIAWFTDPGGNIMSVLES
jgi:hypothetical protein